MPSNKSAPEIEIGNFVDDLPAMLSFEVFVLVDSSPFSEITSHSLEIVLGKHTFTVLG
jgi:hypothetical protein